MCWEHISYRVEHASGFVHGGPLHPDYLVVRVITK